MDFVNDEYEYESDPFQTDDEDIDYEPNKNDTDLYNSSDNEFDYIEEELKQNIDVKPHIALLSKDKTIQYSLDEPKTLQQKESSFRLKTGPTVCAASRCVDPLSAFLLLIEPIEKIVVNMTNLYGSRKYDKWTNVDVRTMRAYYGLLLLAGVYRSHGEYTTELWDKQTGRPIFRATMSLKRYKEITQCLRFDSLEERANLRARDRLAAIRNIFDKWVRRLKVIYTPGKNVTVDQQILPYRGRCPFTQYVPSNPVKYGIKHWILCDAATSYVYNIDIYVGQNHNCTPEINQGEQVVLQLSEGLNGRNITCDNFFTSHALAVKLKQRKITIVGSIRKNRKELPPLLLDMNKQPLYHSKFAFDHNLDATLVSYVTKRRRFVTLLSTMHKTRQINDVKKIPEVIKFHNATKNGVKKMNEMVETYRCKRENTRWPVTIFCNMLDISALNAFIVFTELNPNWNYTKKNIRHQLFLIELGNSLVFPHIEHSERIAKEKINEVARVCDEQPSSSVADRISNKHLMHHTPSKKRARCHICPQTRNANVHSVECDICKKKVCTGHRFILCEKCDSQ